VDNADERSRSWEYAGSEVKISAEARTEFGKGGARRTRRAGKVPAVLYGHGEAPKHIALPAREFAAAIRHGGINQIFAISLADGSETLALPKAIQRDPLKDTFDHVDLLIVRRGEKITVEVPVQLVGEAARGTLVINEHDRLAINADALQLPDHLEASIEGLEAGSRVTAADVKLPSGVELAADPDLIVALVSVAPTAEQLEGEGAGEVEEPEAAEAAAEAEGAPEGEAPEAPPAE
jgi:large subunit ribosomal protein L25